MKKGILFILLAVCFLGLGGTLFYFTFGIRLLLISAFWGRFCKYFWIAFLLGICFLIPGVCLVKKARRLKKEAKRQEAVPAQTAPAETAAGTEATVENAPAEVSAETAKEQTDTAKDSSETEI